MSILDCGESSGNASQAGLSVMAIQLGWLIREPWSEL